MTAIKLKSVLKTIKVPQARLGEVCAVSPATISQIVNHNKWPTEPMGSVVKGKIQKFLAANKMLPALIDTAFEAANEVALPGGTPAEPDHVNDQSQEDFTMLLPKQLLSQQALAHFNLTKAPFGDLRSDDDLWQSKDIRVVREHMYDTAKFGGITAVIGESGAGKTSIRRSLLNRIEKENGQIIVAQPYMLAAEDSEKKGKLLKITHISDSILRAVAPLSKARIGSDAKFNQLHTCLLNLEKNKQRVCLIIDEAHSLSIPSLKHLKRLVELEPAGGYGSLLSVILIGQPELKTKLDERNPEIRELVQRCDVVALKPIAVAELEEFINFRLQGVGKKAAEIIDQSGINAIAQILKSGDGKSQLWPLLVGNFLIAAMNKAAFLGNDIVNDEIVKGVL